MADDELQITRDALNSDPHNITHLLRLGNALVEAAWADGDNETWRSYYAEAGDVYREVLAKDGDNAIALVNLGVVLSDQGSHRQALKLYRRAEKIGWIDGNLLHNIGVAMLNLCDDESGIPYLHRAETQRDHPETIKAYFDPQAH